MEHAIEILKQQINKSKNRLETLRSQYDEIDNMPDSSAKHSKSVECSILIETEQQNLNRMEEFLKGVEPQTEGNENGFKKI